MTKTIYHSPYDQGDRLSINPKFHKQNIYKIYLMHIEHNLQMILVYCYRIWGFFQEPLYSYLWIVKLNKSITIWLWKVFRIYHVPIQDSDYCLLETSSKYNMGYHYFLLDLVCYHNSQLNLGEWLKHAL